MLTERGSHGGIEPGIAAAARTSGTTESAMVMNAKPSAARLERALRTSNAAPAATMAVTVSSHTLNSGATTPSGSRKLNGAGITIQIAIESSTIAAVRASEGRRRRNVVALAVFIEQRKRAG